MLYNLICNNTLLGVDKIYDGQQHKLATIII